MGTIRSVRVATDFSAGADRALGRAAVLAKQAGISQGSLVHVLDSHRVRAVRDLLPVLAGLERDLSRSAEASLEKQAAELTRRSGVTFSASLVEGDVAAQLIDGAGSDDLLVVGATGSSNIKDMLLGSVAEKTVRRSEAPVLVVRSAAEAEYARVVVPVDFSDDSRAALELAAKLAPSAELYLVHAFMPLPITAHLQAPLSEADIAAYGKAIEEKVDQQFDALLADCKIDSSRVQRVTDYGHPPLVIREKANELGADLVVMGRHGQHKIKDWLLGSVTSNVLQHCARDVLVVRS